MPLHVINEETTDVQLPVFAREVTLTDAQIKTLPTSAVELIPAPGAGKKIVVLDAEVVLDTTAGAYTVDINSRWQLFLGTREITGLAEVQSALQLTPGVYSIKFPPFAAVGSAGDSGYLITSPKDFSLMVNQPLRIKDGFNGVANYEDGNPANNGKVKVIYTIIEI